MGNNLKRKRRNGENTVDKHICKHFLPCLFTCRVTFEHWLLLLLNDWEKMLLSACSMTRGPGVWIGRGEAVDQGCHRVMLQGIAGAVPIQSNSLSLIGSISKLSIYIIMYAFFMAPLTLCLNRTTPGYDVLFGWVSRRLNDGANWVIKSRCRSES